MRVIRVLFGFALACLAAAAALVLFVYTPAELASLPSGMGADRVTEAGFFAIVVTPHVAMFAALPALVGVIIGERRGRTREDQTRPKLSVRSKPSDHSSRPGITMCPSRMKWTIDRRVTSLAIIRTTRASTLGRPNVGLLDSRAIE